MVASGFIFLVLVLGMTGCGMMRFAKSPPKASINSLLLTNMQTGLVTFPILQQQVMRFADIYASTVAQACDEISTSTTNAQIRLLALRWKLGQATSAYTDATGLNPAVNALDILVLVSMARMVVEGYGQETYGDVVLPLLDVQRSLESNAWTMASGVLRPAQQQELKDMIQEWRVKNPNVRYIGSIRFREFVSALGKMPSQSSTAPTSIFSLLYLDPLAGLDPTAAAIEQTRELGERAMYYTQRMPGLLSWQAEVLSYQLAGQPASEQLLSDVDRVADAVEIFSKTTQQLPQQILDGLTNNSVELLKETRRTLESANTAAANVNAAILSLTTFVQYVAPTNTAASSSTATNSKPFNVLDYGTAAAQIGTAATNLDALLASLNQTTPQLEKLGQQTSAEADRVVHHAFIYGLVLVLILLVGSVLAGLTYRILANKLIRDARK